MLAAAVVMMGWLGAKAGRDHPKVVAAMAGLLTIFTVATLPRTLHMGTRAEYLAGTAPTLGADFFAFAGPWFFWSGLVFNFCIVSLERHRRALASD